MYQSPKFLRHPIVHEINGQKCTLLTVGHLANCLGRSTWTIRHWTRVGLLPEPVFHLNPGNPHARRTLYPEPYVLALADIIDRGYVGRRLNRAEWLRFQDEAWAAFSATVLPLIGGVKGVGVTGGAAETGGQAISED
jgi:hypothetical protein